MESVQVLCCLCGLPMTYSQAKMCINCLSLRATITDTIDKENSLEICRYCDRYNRPPWLSAKLESPELLQICLTRIKGLNKVKLIDAAFVWTEEHSRRIKVKLTIQKEVEGTMLEQQCLVSFVIIDTQCEDCQRSFTPHQWMAKVQLRQKVSHKRTIYYLEQIILKNHYQKDCLGVKPKKNGIDFHFGTKNHAQKFIDYIHSAVPLQVKMSKELISSDPKSNTYNYKFTFLAEIIPICREDLLVLPKSQRIAGLGRVVMCYRLASLIRVLDVRDFRTGEIKSDRYWKQPFQVYAGREWLEEFIVLDIDERSEMHEDEPNRLKTIEVEVARSNDARFGETTYRVKTHLGNILRVGDTVLGYNLENMVDHGLEIGSLDECPPVVLVKKIISKEEKQKPKIKIERLAEAEAEEEPDFGEFVEEVENDPELQSQILGDPSTQPTEIQLK